VPARAAGGGGHGGTDFGAELGLISVLPFAGILLSIAVFPLVAPRFWHHHYPKVSFLWALAFAVPALWAYRATAFREILHIYLVDYVPFIILLGGLFTAAGGIVVRGTLAGTPKVNTTMLLIGTSIASFVGTTGAAMLLIRPLLRANAGRRYRVHTVVFFIFLVANIGGSLTPLGDPPLFLGFLHGVPFAWTFGLFPEMLLASVVLLTLYFGLDTWLHRKEASQRGTTSQTPDPEARPEPLRVDGLYNLLFLAGIMGAVLMSGVWRDAGDVVILGTHVGIQSLLRDVLIVVMALLSLYFTPSALRKDNGFTWEPIREVAILFAGIFMTIVPALAILKAGEDGHLAFLIRAVEEPWHYFWVTGGLSSFLDNAPTYLTFFNTELGRFFPGLPEAEAVPRLIEEFNIYLKAVAVGAVFMGANTYIGNAPNFMVKSIAEEAGIRMPSFFGFIFKWSLPILIPLFVVITWIFFL
jgi:Na+/H+ antiporter NhaD/arsenite permease-like protein